MVDEGFGYTSSLCCGSETRDCVFQIYVDCQIPKRQLFGLSKRWLLHLDFLGSHLSFMCSLFFAIGRRKILKNIYFNCVKRLKQIYLLIDSFTEFFNN